MALIAMNIIRMVKLFGWETKINERIAATREEELKGVRKREILTMLIHVLQCVYACNESSNLNSNSIRHRYIIPLVQMLASFIVYVRRLQTPRDLR